MAKRSFIEVAPIAGWALVTREESDHETGECGGEWYIAWQEIFGTKASALAFANANGWRKPFQAIRATLSPA